MDALALAWERLPASLKADLATGEIPDAGQDGIAFFGERHSDGRWRIIGRLGKEERVVAFGSNAERMSPTFYDGGGRGQERDR
jgi:hypothetical protein